jgi:hypothetical protein
MSTLQAVGSVITDGLVLYLDAANYKSYPGSGTTWSDLTINNNSGSLTNGPTFSSANGGSIVFDGVDDYADFGNGTSINIADSLTVNIWFYITGTSSVNYASIIQKRNNATSEANYGINFINNANFQWYYTSAAQYRVLGVSYASYFTTNTWYNVCGTFKKNGSNTDAVLYRNGISIASSTLTGNVVTNTSSMRIGNLVNIEYFQGNVSNAQIYNRALSAQEVLQNYNALKRRFNL